jgi:hypothetical protein
LDRDGIWLLARRRLEPAPHFEPDNVLNLLQIVRTQLVQAIEVWLWPGRHMRWAFVTGELTQDVEVLVIASGQGHKDIGRGVPDGTALELAQVAVGRAGRLFNSTER